MLGIGVQSTQFFRLKVSQFQTVNKDKEWLPVSSFPHEPIAPKVEPAKSRLSQLSVGSKTIVKVLDMYSAVQKDMKRSG